MKLLVDIGNTRIKLCPFSRELGYGQMQSIEHSDLGLEGLKSCLDSYQNVESIWVGCVSKPQLVELLNQATADLYGLQPELIKVSPRLGDIKNGYEALGQLGVDRWLAAIGARELVAKGGVICVDVGTAVTVDYLDADDVFQGGVIIPGPRLMSQALKQGTHAVKTQFKSQDNIFGKTTAECVNSGIYYGLAGAIENIVFTMRMHSKIKIKTIITGGAAPTIHWSPEFSSESLFDDLLVIRGINKVSQCGI
jgi:type III pantothenate kinase